MNLRRLFKKALVHTGLMDRVSVRGELHIRLWDQDGNLKDERWLHNLVVTDGLTHIADQMADQGEDPMSHMAIGTGSGQGAGDTTLATELDRNALNAGPTHVAGVVSYQGLWAAGDGTGAITEAGIFNAAEGGDMLCYQDFDVVTKGANDVLTIDWTLTFTDAG